MPLHSAILMAVGAGLVVPVFLLGRVMRKMANTSPLDEVLDQSYLAWWFTLMLVLDAYLMVLGGYLAVDKAVAAILVSLVAIPAVIVLSSWAWRYYRQPHAALVGPPQMTCAVKLAVRIAREYLNKGTGVRLSVRCDGSALVMTVWVNDSTSRINRLSMQSPQDAQLAGARIKELLVDPATFDAVSFVRADNGGWNIEQPTRRSFLEPGAI